MHFSEEPLILRAQAVLKYAADVTTLNKTDLKTEYNFYKDCIQLISEYVEKEESPSQEMIRMGGVLFSVIGIPLCFVAPPVALPITVGGFLVTALGEFLGAREVAQQRQVHSLSEPIVLRYKQLHTEVMARF